MGINNLHFSPELIAALYPESLVAGDRSTDNKKQDIPKSPTRTPAPAYPFLGKNLRSICFLVSHPDHEFMPEGQLAFLYKILTACKCGPDDIALVNTAVSPVHLDELKIQLHPQILFLWGAVPAITGQIHELQDMTISTLDGISVVPVLQADIMSRDNKDGLELKQRLWTCLKKLFSL